MAQPTHDAEVDRIARELESYVSLHRAAADTLDGIARWWLARSAQAPLSQVEVALDLLVNRNVLTRRQLPDGNFVYARAPDRQS